MALPRTGLIDETTGGIIERLNSNLGQNSNSSATGVAGMTVDKGTKPLYGFSNRYAPEGAKQAFDNPWYILPDVFKGINSTSPGYQGLRDFGGDPLSLYNIMSGNDRTIEDQGGGEFINFMADLYKNLGTVGGRGFSSRGLLDNIMSASKDDKTTLGQILSAGDQSTQTRSLFNLLRDVSNVSMNPLAASGYQAAVARAGDAYGNAMMQSDAGSVADMGPTQWMMQNAPWLFGR